MSDGKVFVVMTASGRVQERKAMDTIQEVLEELYREHLVAGGDWDRPTKLFIDGSCVIDGPLADLAWEYGKYREARDEEAYAACEAWVKNRFADKTESEAA